MDLKAVLDLSKEELVSRLKDLGFEYSLQENKSTLQMDLLNSLSLVRTQESKVDIATACDSVCFDSALDERRQFLHDVPRYLPLLPKFNESDVREFFALFERICFTYGWKREFWILLLQHCLFGKGSRIFTSLPLERSSDYEYVKERILNAYAVSPEELRLRFRMEKRRDNETFLEFSRRKRYQMEEWISGEKCKTAEDFKGLMFKECFFSFLTDEEKDFLLIRGCREDVSLCAEILDDRRLQLNSRVVPTPTYNTNGGGKTRAGGQQEEKAKLQSSNTSLKLACSYCQKTGHPIERCYKKKKEESNSLYCTLCKASGHSFENCTKR